MFAYVAESFDRPCYFLRIKKRPAMLAGLIGNSVCFIFENSRNPTPALRSVPPPTKGLGLVEGHFQNPSSVKVVTVKLY
jgi:hypothetical protein